MIANIYHKENDIWVNRGNLFKYKENNEWKDIDLYFKHENEWVLIFENDNNIFVDFSQFDTGAELFNHLSNKYPENFDISQTRLQSFSGYTEANTGGKAWYYGKCNTGAANKQSYSNVIDNSLFHLVVTRPVKSVDAKVWSGTGTGMCCLYLIQNSLTYEPFAVLRSATVKYFYKDDRTYRENCTASYLYDITCDIPSDIDYKDIYFCSYKTSSSGTSWSNGVYTISLNIKLR